jgi:co-chaperonin GroES (HSP10)
MRVDTSKIVPVNGSMLVSDDKKDEVSKGGIVIPGVVGDDNVIIGTVHSSSPFLLESGKLQDPASVGSKAMYSTHAGAGNVWKDDAGVTWRLIKWNDVLAYVNA